MTPHENEPSLYDRFLDIRNRVHLDAYPMPAKKKVGVFVAIATLALGGSIAAKRKRRRNKDSK